MLGVQVDGVLCTTKQQQLQHIEALQLLQHSLQEVCLSNPDKLEGLAISLQLPDHTKKVGHTLVVTPILTRCMASRSIVC